MTANVAFSVSLKAISSRFPRNQTAMMQLTKARRNKMPAISKSEILFLYESVYSIPNGDPFTNEQRYDDETKKILVSDVRIKRYIRDQIANTNPEAIFVYKDPAAPRPEKTGDPESGAA